MMLRSANATLDVTAIGRTLAGAIAVGGAAAAAGAGGTVAFVGVEGEPDASVGAALQRAGVLLRPRAQGPLSARAARSLLIDGLSWQHPAGGAAVEQAAAAARAAGRQVVLALSEPGAIHRRRHTLLNFMRGGVDLLFCGPVEACALYDTHRLDTAILQIQRACPLAVLDRGSRGFMVIEPAAVRQADPAPAVPAEGAWLGALLMAQPWGRDPLDSCRMAGGLLGASVRHAAASGVRLPRLTGSATGHHATGVPA